MSQTVYVAGNWTKFYWDFVNEAGQPIIMSGLASATLHITMPDLTVITDTAAFDAAGTDNNRVSCTTKLIVPANMGSLPKGVSAPVWWRLQVILTTGSEPISSPSFVQPFQKPVG